jgi:cardiolipin synthase
LLEYLPHISVAALLDTLILVLVIPWVLLKKRDPTVAVAWCLVILLVPLLGALLFWVFGYNYIHRRVRGKGEHQAAFRKVHPPTRREATRGVGDADTEAAQAEEFSCGPLAEGAESAPPGSGRPACPALARLGLAVNAFPVSHGNAVTLYHDTGLAWQALLEEVGKARHHIHLEFFILRADPTGRLLLDLLAEKARAGVEVRFLYDAAGGLFLKGRVFRRLRRAGGLVSNFLPVNPLRSWIHVNLRNHRKIVVVDGQVGFTGGMNVGDEYLGKSKRFGYWRDTVVRLQGPAVASLQRIFAEDWDFACSEPLNAPAYFPDVPEQGEGIAQLVGSGPDQEPNSIREIYFGAILSARHRLWIASPYFVPDRGLLDALRLACYRGVDVRLLGLLRPDHYVSYYAGRYYWADMLAVGVKVYQYARGMMHSKLMMVDGRWAMAGSANLDNRSLHLNFEVGCMLHSPDLVAQLERRYEEDLRQSVPLDPDTFARRSLLVRLTENAARLFSPVL